MSREPEPSRQAEPRHAESRRAEDLLVPADFEVPLGLDTDRFRLRPLTPAVVELDYEALMTSIDHLNAMFGSKWPHPRFTLEENRQDLVEHQQEFEQRVAFAYTVLIPDETACLGCVYINPPRGAPADAAVDARVHMWVRQSAHERGLDPELFHAVKAWIDERWPFASVAYPGRRSRGGGWAGGRRRGGRDRERFRRRGWRWRG